VAVHRRGAGRAADPLFNHGRMRRDFTFIDDIVDGVLRTLDRPPQPTARRSPAEAMAPHAIYNIGNSRSEELGRLVSLIEQATGRTAIVEHAEMQPGDMTDTFADTSATTRDTGFAARTSLDEGVPQFVRWFRQVKRRKYSIVRARPCSSGIVGSQPSFSRATEMSGWRCLGSSAGSGRRMISELLPVWRIAISASSRMVNSAGLPMLTGPVTRRASPSA
jgi:hypothetical protein